MRKFIYNDYKYHVFTHCDDNGIDEKPEVKTIKQGSEAAKWYLDNGWDTVYLLTDKEVVKVFDEYCRRGRKPYRFESEKFTFNKQVQQQPVQLSLFD